MVKDGMTFAGARPATGRARQFRVRRRGPRSFEAVLAGLSGTASIMRALCLRAVRVLQRAAPVNSIAPTAVQR
jgi:hypothetical protein